ncbi:hypothetical protein [Afifella sp. IM 167]|uniref:hypothetical protein n=1 Tax=Afifella sp. IM 167 TaxID=2033586 RepID=UPI001CCE0AFC|nr:hypothetical protein [Afifella sp. IM 167]MBZ8132437.1 hypothetical protein [Afifella sp. IM 167]
MTDSNTPKRGPASSLAAALLVFLALQSPAAAEAPTGRFVLSATLYHEAGMASGNYFLPPGYSDLKARVPKEVEALGFVTGDKVTGSLDGHFGFAFWPWVVFDAGVPVAAVMEPAEGLSAAGFPASADIGGLPKKTSLHYERQGDSLVVSGRSLDAEKARFEDGSLGFSLMHIAGSVTPLTSGGCFDLRLEYTLEAYRTGASEPFLKQTDNMPRVERTVCLDIVKTNERPGGSRAHLMKADVGNDVLLFAIGFSREGSAVAAADEPQAAGGTYIKASGDLGFFQREGLDRANRFAAAIEESVMAQNYDLAERQIGQLKAHLADMRSEGIAWSWVRLPTEAGVERYETLAHATDLYKSAYMETQARLVDVQRQLLVLRTGFSANVVKTMLRSTVDWLDVVPSDPLSALADYSDIAGAISLTQTLKAWKENAERDASLLTSQVNAIRQFEALEAELGARVDEIVAARRALFERIEQIGERRALELHAALQAG